MIFSLMVDLQNKQSIDLDPRPELKSKENCWSKEKKAKRTEDEKEGTDHVSELCSMEFSSLCNKKLSG